MKNSAGVSETYFIDPRTSTAHKVRVLKEKTNNEKKEISILGYFVQGSCSEQFKTFLNEGVSIYNDRLPGKYRQIQQEKTNTGSFKEQNEEITKNELQ